jgi:diaminopimelate epimerase
MNSLRFYKYQGTGNDFILLDNRSGELHFDKGQIEQLCDRRFGIGADGLILINNSKEHDFEMNYYNSDGSQSFCGNGGRCAIAFAHFLGIIKNNAVFSAIDGVHSGIFHSENNIELGMNPPSDFKEIGKDYFIHTGSPHYISFCEDLSKQNIVEFGKSIRYNDVYKKEGVNVNLVQQNEDSISILTYERGVEDETFSCGTGATAAVLVQAKLQSKKSGTTMVHVKGGELHVIWDSINAPFDLVKLVGPAKKVYEGNIQL